MFSYINAYLSDPMGMLLLLAIALPGRLLAISAHEAAHAWMADRCGDPTARMLGRVSLNPFRHLDLIGTLMMVFVGFGWAKPVPVNPRNFRNYRRDDLLVSIAGVTTNFILFLAGSAVMYAFAGFALAKLRENGIRYDPVSITSFLKQPYYFSHVLIGRAFGEMASYVYDMLMYFVLTNLVLGLFNLIPIPPLDGYHVLNDLLLKRPLFASPQVARGSSAILMLLVFSGFVSTAIGALQNGIFGVLGGLFAQIFRMLGVY